LSAAGPSLFFLSDQLETPPRLGYQIHVLSLAAAAAPHIRTRALCWAGAGAPVAPHLVTLDPAAAPRANLARKLHYLRRAFEVIDREAAPGSVVWIRNYSTALLALPWMARRRRAGLRFLYDAASILRLEARESPDRIAAEWRGCADEWLWRRFDLVRTLNGPMRDYLVARGVPAARVLVFPVGAEAQAARWSPHGEVRRLLYIGSAMAWQGLPELIEAMGRLEAVHPGVRLSVVGPGRHELGGVRVPGNVDVLGRVPHADIGRIYLEHDLFVLPRPRTPLTELVSPMKIPEAMSFGIPILASDLPAIRWTTGDDGALWVRGEGAGALAEALRAAIADPAGLAAVAARGLERSAEFEWDTIGRRIVEALFGGSL